MEDETKKQIKAFPKDSRSSISQDGMDLRDYFAAKAMQGILANSYDEIMNYDSHAIQAYFIADAMMKAREQQ